MKIHTLHRFQETKREIEVLSEKLELVYHELTNEITARDEITKAEAAVLTQTIKDLKTAHQRMHEFSAQGQPTEGSQ